MRNDNGRWRLPVVALAWLFALGVMGGALMAKQAQQPAPAPPRAPAPTLAPDDPDKVQADAEGYVGTKECARCHEGETKAYRASLHAQDANARTPAAAKGCESCHGPGEAHVDDPGAKGRIKVFSKMAPREVNAFCQTCHNRQEHEQWQGSMHDARNVSCVNCHSLMAPKSEEKLLKGETVTATCAQCHRDKAAKMQRANHMPIREGKMQCTSCHNQHGSSNVRLLRAGNTINEFCTSCHAEKRGPFLWEHPPVRENCASCHEPHGSPNDRLLVAKVPMLCQRCHVAAQHPATIYDGLAVTNRNNRVINRGCVNCHSQVHGSNHPSGARFQR